MSNTQPPTNHRSLTGFVTKLVGDGATYGFINDEIFFPQTNVSGGPAAVGDQVFAECEFSAHLPIKWNATSVKILNKSSGQSGNIAPDQTQQQGLLNQQQFNQSSPVAVTYQQHRQQRQKQDNTPHLQQPQQVEHNTRMLDQGINSGEYYGGGGGGGARAFPQQQQQQQPQQDTNIQPFQDQPMGPPNFTYTSQLGSAFVQNQYVPAPFMAQQPLLPHQQHNPVQNNPTNQRHNQHNNNNNNKGQGGRFNNQNDKNDRQQNRRNMNRNDNKFDSSRERDNTQNNRSSRNRDNRDRSIGGGGGASKRDDPPTRPSPPTHSSARSSISSDRGHKSRRHYDVQNIPKTQIMTNMNAYNMKQRCPSSVHVPSDLKDIIVNRHFRLDIKSTPKPIKFTIEQVKVDEAKAVAKESSVETEVSNEAAVSSLEKEASAEVHEDILDEIKQDTKEEPKASDQETPVTSKPEVRMTHKYGVKVILLSMPDMENIYRHVFGEKLDSFSSDSKSRLDDAINLVCNKSSNNGYSLIGGKFDPALDGFLEDNLNEFERNGIHPDLITTCKRLVLDQVGLDLSQCKSWSLLSTFMYNHKSDYFSSKASLEYSFIYVPHIWTMLGEEFDKSFLNKESLDQHPLVEEETVEVKQESSEVKDVSMQDMMEVETKPLTSDDVPTVDQCSILTGIETSISLDNLGELKVTDLKAELERRNIKYKGSPKKAELLNLLKESLQTGKGEGISEQELKDDEPTDQEIAEEATSTETKLEEGEVEADTANGSPETETNSVEPTESINKRKCEELDEELATKKVCSDSPTKVELNPGTFVIRAKSDQQISLVPLHEATQASKYDQFELSVASNILKESLVQHLSEYILTALVEDNKQKMPPTNTGSTSTSSSQDTSSDTNNNNNSSTKTGNFKNPSSSDDKTITKELPVDRYITLAFTYFDANHVGYMYADDLNKLFNNTGLTISKRALIALLGDAEKFSYRTLPDLSPKLVPGYIYRFPDQFSRLPGSGSKTGGSNSAELTVKSANRMIEYQGVTYELEKLIQQAKEAETIRVSLVDRFNYAIENSDRQAEEIHVLEVSQKSLSNAIKAQNDEICELKRERDSIKKKYESVRKGIKSSVSSLSDLVKDEK